MSEEKNKSGYYISIIVFGMFLLIVGYSLFVTYGSSNQMASRHGTGISGNWVNSMNWLQNNTPKCTVVATYWDPGYWIAALSERKIVFDGGSQGSKRHTKLSNLNGLDCVEDRQGYVKEIDGTKYCVTSRIQDMSGVLSTSNETWAAKVLESYMGECNELYELASNDLIGKSHWWTYFSHWDPEKGKGQAYDYALFPYKKQQELSWQDGKALIYGPFVLKILNKNGTQEIIPYMVQQSQYNKIEKMVLVQNGSISEIEYPNATVSGTLWVSLDGTPLSQPSGKCIPTKKGSTFCVSHINVPNFCSPSRRQYALCRPYAIYMNDVIEDSLFTKMFFYNGKGLEYFEPSYVNNPEVKLFRLNVEKLREDMKNQTS